MTLTPEDLARQTIWSREQWRQAEEILGATFQALCRQVAEVALARNATPAQVATLLSDPATRRGVAGSDSH